MTRSEQSLLHSVYLEYLDGDFPGGFKSLGSHYAVYVPSLHISPNRKLLVSWAIHVGPVFHRSFKGITDDSKSHRKHCPS